MKLSEGLVLITPLPERKKCY